MYHHEAVYRAQIFEGVVLIEYANQEACLHLSSL